MPCDFWWKKGKKVHNVLLCSYTEKKSVVSQLQSHRTVIVRDCDEQEVFFSMKFQRNINDDILLLALPYRKKRKI